MRSGWIDFRRLEVRLFKLHFDDSRQGVIAAELFEPEVYAARSLVDPIFGLPRGTVIVSPGLPGRELQPTQSRLSALDLICFLHRGWPRGQHYDHN